MEWYVMRMCDGFLCLGGGGGFSDKSSNIQLIPPSNVILLKYPANSY